MFIRKRNQNGGIMPISKSVLLLLAKMNRPAGVSDETWARVDEYLNGEGNTFQPHQGHLAGARALADLHWEATRGKGPQINFDAKKPNPAYGRMGKTKKSLSPWQKNITSSRYKDHHTTRENWWSDIAPLFVHPDTPEHERGLVDTLRNRVIQHETPGMARKERAGEEIGYHGLSYLTGEDFKPMEDRSYGGRREVTPGDTVRGPEVTTPELPAFPDYRSNVDWRQEGHSQTETEKIPTDVKAPKKTSYEGAVQKLLEKTSERNPKDPNFIPPPDPLLEPTDTEAVRDELREMYSFREPKKPGQHHQMSAPEAAVERSKRAREEEGVQGRLDDALTRNFLRRYPYDNNPWTNVYNERQEGIYTPTDVSAFSLPISQRGGAYSGDAQLTSMGIAREYNPPNQEEMRQNLKLPKHEAMSAEDRRGWGMENSMEKNEGPGEHPRRPPKWEQFGDPDYKQDIRAEKRERAQMNRQKLPMSTLREFQRRKLETQQGDIERGIKGMPELYVNYPEPSPPPAGLSRSGMLAYLAQQGGERPDVPGEASKIPHIPVDAKRAFDSGFGMRSFGPEEHKTDYPRNKTEWKLTNVQNSVSKLLKLVKEGEGGDGGSGIGGLNGVVFTSTNAGIFTPTHGGSKSHKQLKRKKRRHDKKRQKLLGRGKSNGVEKFERFVNDLSPISKAVNRQMDGKPSDIAHNPQDNLMRVDYKKLGKDREIGTANEPNASMSGTNSKMDASVGATEPVSEDPGVSRQDVPAKTPWNNHKAYMQKAGVGGFVNIGPQPDQNPESPPPQYVERGKDPNKPQYQDVKMNDFVNRVKKYDNKEDDGGVDQDMGAAAGAAKTIMNDWNSGNERGIYRRSEEGDDIPPDEDDNLEPSESDEVIDALEDLQAKKNKYLAKGSDRPLYMALMEDYGFDI